MVYTYIERWQPIETAPKGRKLIVSVPNGKNHKPITMMGRYWPRGTFEVAEGYEDEDWAVEVNGEFYMPEGWYEECEVEDAPAHNIDPTHWQPLPPPPAVLDGHLIEQTEKSSAASLHREAISERPGRAAVNPHPVAPNTQEEGSP